MEKPFKNNLDPIILPLFTSKVRLKLLQAFFRESDEMRYVRDLVREVKEEINAVRRELKILHRIGLLRSERRQNRLYFALKTDFPYYPELQRVAVKSHGFARKLREQAHLLGQIRYMFFVLPFFWGREPKETEVDLLIVGRVDLSHLKQLINKEESRIKREINYSVMTEEEFNFRKKRKDPFILSLLSQPKLILVGSEKDLNY